MNREGLWNTGLGSLTQGPYRWVGGGSREGGLNANEMNIIEGE